MYPRYGEQSFGLTWPCDYKVIGVGLRSPAVLFSAVVCIVLVAQTMRRRKRDDGSYGEGGGWHGDEGGACWGPIGYSMETETN